MQVNQYQYQKGLWDPKLPKNNDEVQLLLVFGSRQLIQENRVTTALRQSFPRGECVGCTTSGEIMGTEVYDETLVVTAIHLSTTDIDVKSVNIGQFERSFDAGTSLAQSLDKKGLKYVMVLSDGQLVNGTELVEGMSRELTDKVLITGGMAGDSDRFDETLVWHNQNVKSGNIVVCGFYGESLQVGHGTLGGWSAFGPDRIVTRSSKNVLYELDDQPALDLYKKYLGEFSEQLPSSALRFPLSLQLEGEEESVVRTILNINESDKSMVFAGDMPEGATANMMKANFETLIDGANGAAKGALLSVRNAQPELALLISCVGRRLVLNQRAYEELEAVEEVLSEQCPMAGFYSYGEISPLLNSTQCRLHNQTMTITTLSEKVNA